ncbi:MAG TPA: hypothetical protein VFR02_00755, partial [bacterium]|nr:hypothetical protein [bacterium]
AQGADMITYTLTYSNLGSTTISNAAVTDTLPSGMTYVNGSASNGGLFNAGQVTWALPALLPGASLTLTYQAQVGLQVHTGQVLVNHACLSYGGQVNCASSSVTILGDYVVRVSVFNASGELVKTLDTFELGQPISSFDLGSDVLRTDGDVLQIYADGMSLDAWNGTNAAGQKVSNGTYFVEIDSTDPFGVTTTVTQQATVLLGSNTLDFVVYNSAGEAVLSLDAAQIEALIGGPLTSADFDLGKATFSPLVITPSYADPTGRDTSVLITLGSGRSFRWSGTNDGGKILSPGQYLLSFKGQMSGKPSQNVTTQVTLLGCAGSPIQKVLLKPNPIYLDQTQTAYFEVTVNAPRADNVRVKIYTLAGELTGQVLVNDPGNLSQVTWHLDGVNLASGMYFADIEVRQGDQLLDRQVLKLAILR